MSGAGRKRVNLALQGGGAHGAFTWGVLDRLLADDGIEIAAITATSAGALNGAAVKAGLAAGGPADARERLRALWTRIGASTAPQVHPWLAPFAPSTGALADMIEWSPAFAVLDATSRMVSPYVFGPMIRNPLAATVEAIGMEDCRRDAGPRFFVSATNVRSGTLRVFQGREVTVDAILASACLPTLFQAVEIDGEAYWDGGYTGNPALHPLYDPGLPDDVVVVNINPLRREALPRDGQAIANRVNEISFNASLFRDLRAIRFVRRLIAAGSIQKGAFKDVLVHMIADDALMNDLNVATKILPNPVILGRLFEAGEAACAAFLDAHRDDLGARPTIDLDAMFA
ncbi:MAG: patatin-like phospholipase family protein [Paracoccaceae bacterium]